MLRADSWLCTSELCLVDWGILLGCWRLNPGYKHAKQATSLQSHLPAPNSFLMTSVEHSQLWGACASDSPTSTAGPGEPCSMYLPPCTHRCVFLTWRCSSTTCWKQLLALLLLLHLVPSCGAIWDRLVRGPGHPENLPRNLAGSCGSSVVAVTLLKVWGFPEVNGGSAR